MLRRIGLFASWCVLGSPKRPLQVKQLSANMWVSHPQLKTNLRSDRLRRCDICCFPGGLFRLIVVSIWCQSPTNKVEVAPETNHATTGLPRCVFGFQGVCCFGFETDAAVQTSGSPARSPQLRRTCGVPPRRACRRLLVSCRSQLVLRRMQQQQCFTCVANTLNICGYTPEGSGSRAR